MPTTNTDKAWEYFGQHNPYFAVLTQGQYTGEKWGEDAKREFFATGDRYVKSIVSTVCDNLSSRFCPTRALDFGCGVGRLVIPLARVCQFVTGIDVSESMIAEARKNVGERGLGNVAFVRGDDSLSELSGTFDFIHSFIVFQHIPPGRGVVIFKKLIDLLEDGGIGVLHVTYSHSSTTTLLRRCLKAAKQSLPLFATMLNVLKGRPVREPVMQMNTYDVNRLLRILQESGCHEVHLRFTETSVQGDPFYGLSFFFKKRGLDVRAHA